MTKQLIIVGVLILLGLALWRISHFPWSLSPESLLRRSRESKGHSPPAFPDFRVVTTDAGIACEHPIRKREFIEWDQVTEISVMRINVADPLSEENTWVIFAGKEGGCSIPLGAADFDKVFEAAKRFPGFNYEGFLDAEVGSPRVCWQKTIGG